MALKGNKFPADSLQYKNHIVTAVNNTKTLDKGQTHTFWFQQIEFKTKNLWVIEWFQFGNHRDCIILWQQKIWSQFSNFLSWYF